jgi:GNAT superfamily N-acetyltransferase
MQIRRAQTSDAAALNDLLQQLGYAQGDTETTAGRIQLWGDDPAGAAYVAEADGEVLGVIAVHTCPFFERAGSWGRIVALVVDEHARGKGVGGRLVAAAEEFADSRDCVRMEVTSNDRRVDAHAFYQGRGYVLQTGKSSRFLRDLTAASRWRGSGQDGFSGGRGRRCGPRR